MAKFSLIGYFKESYDEWMHKVSWPTWSELQNSAIVVSVASLIIAISGLFDGYLILIASWKDFTILF